MTISWKVSSKRFKILCKQKSRQPEPAFTFTLILHKDAEGLQPVLPGVDTPTITEGDDRCENVMTIFEILSHHIHLASFG